MKMKTLLQVAFVALLVGWGFYPNTLKAQTWTGNTPQAGDFYLYNVEAGKFLTSGCWWGTHAAMDYDGMLLTFAGSGNDYTLSTNVAFANCYVGDNAYMDNGSAATWTFTQVSAGKYTMKNGSNYLVFKGGDVADTDNTAPTTDAGYWQIVSRADLINNMKSATPSSPVDASFFMENPKIRRNWKNSKPFSGTGITDNGSFNASSATLYGGGCTSVGQYRKTFDNYQVLTGLPNGKYQVTVKGQYRNNDNSYAIPYMYANDQKTSLKLKGDIGGDDATNATKSLVDDTYLTEAVTVTVTDGNLRVGVKSDANVDWCTWREFTIKFLSPQLSFAAEELPANGNMTADQWYYIDISVAGNNYKATATNLGNIVYTTDGTILRENESSVTNTFAVSDNNLSATRYYVKSSTANNLVVEAASYIYEVGSATSDYDYVQGGETVTITYANAASNDPNVSFAKNGNPTITFGGSAVAITPTSNGFTFTAPTVTPGTSYTLSIPANAFGYAANGTYNAAQEITIKVPAIFDGTYFFKDDNDKFWLRGEPYGSAVQVYDWGMPVNITTDALGATTLHFADASDWKIFSDGTGIYADNASHANSTWSIIKSGTKYIFKNAVNNHFMKVDGTRILSTVTEEEATAFTLVTPAEHQAVLTAYVNAQASAAATAASLSASTPAELQTAANGIYATTIIEGSTAATTAEKWQGGQWDSRTIYSNTINVTTPGLYKFTIQAFYRMTDNVTTYALHTAQADCPPVYVFFGDAKTPIKSVMDESRATAYEGNNCDYANGVNHYPNQQASSLVAFKEGKYTNTVWVYIAEAGDYSYGIQYLGWAGSHSEWTCYTTESISLTYYYTGSLDYVKDGIHYYKGAFDTAPAIELTDAVPVADVTDATFSGTSSVTFTNPNGLVFAKAASQVNNTTNVVVNGACTTLVLADGHPFVNPTAFTATNASYTLSALAGGSFATLVVPFAAALPSGGAAYTLDQGVDLIDGNIRGTSVSSIAANSPVLVTNAGDYTATNAAIPAIAPGATYTQGELVGTYTAINAPANSFVLQNHTSGEGVAFYYVGATQPKVTPFRAYIKPQASGVRALRIILDGDVDAIGAIDERTEASALDIYGVDGIRRNHLRKGINIIRTSNGSVKKVNVK